MGKGSVIWFTGLSSSGKSTLCGSTATLLAARMRQVQILDADKVREELCSDLGFSKDDQVSFRWKDYAAGSKQKVMTVAADEFLRRFLFHVLPKAWSASATSGSSPTASGPLRCCVAACCSTPPLHHRSPRPQLRSSVRSALSSCL